MQARRRVGSADGLLAPSSMGPVRIPVRFLLDIPAQIMYSGSSGMDPPSNTQLRVIHTWGRRGTPNHISRQGAVKKACLHKLAVMLTADVPRPSHT